MPAIRLLACDMDGTLFRQDLVISNPVQEAIARAQAAGVLVVLATGRMPAAARSFIGMLGLTGPQIYANGALIQSVAGEILYHLPVQSSVAADVVAFSDAREFHANAYVGDEVYVERIGPEAEF
ncbi:MAG TPA: HAD-IIB family hydrolase, partial [Chloroflexota bacterium]|nr:HAD-IIB family hydrolase [Chloroflexota bacterium]